MATLAGTTTNDGIQIVLLGTGMFGDEVLRKQVRSFHMI
jgi:hypothetical protein